MKDLPADLRPREKLLDRGPAALADAELPLAADLRNQPQPAQPRGWRGSHRRLPRRADAQVAQGAVGQRRGRVGGGCAGGQQHLHQAR